MKKLVSLFLALMLVFSLATVAAASSDPETPPVTPAETGSIAINGVGLDTHGAPVATYAVYRILSLESYNPEAKAYSYKADPDWAAFLATDEAKAYLATDASGYVTWVGSDDDSRVAAFAQLALAYAKENDISAVKSSQNAGEFLITKGESGVVTGTFSGLELGYYLVDSTVGALCGLTTTNPTGSVNAKNGTPTLDKQVQEDSAVESQTNTNTWFNQNTADIGQTVNYDVTINVHAGAQNYVFHDKMDAGLTFVHNTDEGRGVMSVNHIVPGENNATTHFLLLEGKDYTVVTEGLEDGCTFHVVFDKDFISGLDTNDKIYISYNAMLNRHAVIAGKGNVNEAWLDFGEGHHTTHDTTTTYTFSIDIVKTDSDKKLIDGAKFKIYDAATGGNEVKVVLLKDANDKNVVQDENGNPIYRRARADETGVPIEVIDGIVTIVGFDNGTYYLEETEAPEGYNKLAERTRFIIADSNLDAIITDNQLSSGSGVHVVNKTGSVLPETGALGATMFLMVGSFLVLATGVLLVTKKRMSMIEE